MRKFWRIGLILVIGLSACGDKKAEQAKTLQEEMQRHAGQGGQHSSKMFTYGDVTVTPDGDAFAVTVDKVAITIPEVSPIDLGKVSFKVTPDGDDIRKFSDLTWPQSLTLKDTDGKEVKITTAIDHATGSWSKKLGQLMSADILLKSLEANEPTSASKLAASDVLYQLQSKDNGQGIYDQSGTGGVKLLTVSDKDGQFSVADLKLDSAIGGAKLAELIAARADWQKAAGSGKPERDAAAARQDLHAHEVDQYRLLDGSDQRGDRRHADLHARRLRLRLRDEGYRSAEGPGHIQPQLCRALDRPAQGAWWAVSAPRSCPRNSG